MASVAVAPGKLIISGEHACVLGEPAVVMAIDRYAKVTAKLRDDKAIHIASKNLGISGSFEEGCFKPEVGGLDATSQLKPIYAAIENTLNLARREVGIDLTIDSEIPAAVGLGSSAAIAVSTVASTSNLLGISLSREEMRSIAHESEKIVHGEPSGVDDMISTYGGILFFKRGTEPSPIRARVDIPLIIGNTGVKRLTGDLVRHVRSLKERYPLIVDPLIRSIGQISEEVRRALRKSSWEELGTLMSINHELLSAIGVSNELLDRLVHESIKAGALGAKLTGAGGGGCIIALAMPDKVKPVMKAIERAGGSPFLVKKDDRGVRAWLEAEEKAS